MAEPRRRIIHVTAYYPPHLGGVERVAQSLAQRLAQDSAVEVWTTRDGREPTTTWQNGLSVTRLPMVEVAHTPIPRGLFSRLLRLPSSAVVHVHVAQALWPELVAIAAAIRGFRVVTHFHLDVDPSGRAGRLLPAYKRWFLGRSLRRSDSVIALTDSQREMLADTYRVDLDRIEVMPNGVEDEFLTLAPAPRSADAPLRLLFVGRVDAQKNVLRLLHAVSAVRAPVELVVVGDGEQRDAAQRLRTGLRLDNVRFVGAQHGKALRDWYAWADVFVLASDREGMPLALLEAMAAGLALLVTDVSDLAAQVGEAGLVVAPDVGAITAGITRLATDRALVGQLRGWSRDLGRANGWDPLVARLEALYDELVA